MSAILQWTGAQGEGFWYNDELSDLLRTELKPRTRFRQLCDTDDGAQRKGLHKGEKYRWNIYGKLSRQGRALAELDPMPMANFDVSQAELTITEYGQGVPITGKLLSLAKHDAESIVEKALRDDARQALDIAPWEQFDLTPLRASAAASTTSVTLDTDSTPTETNAVALSTGHVKAIADIMRERNIPGFTDDDDYVAVSHPSTFRRLADEWETLNQYTDIGHNRIFNGEKGRYEGIRFLEQNFIPKGGAEDSTTFDPYTLTADPWNGAVSSWAFFIGGDTVNEAVVVPEEVRGMIPQDFGRSHGIAWYALLGYGLVHTVAAQARIVKWDSAA